MIKGIEDAPVSLPSLILVMVPREEDNVESHTVTEAGPSGKSEMLVKEENVEEINSSIKEEAMDDSDEVVPLSKHKKLNKDDSDTDSDIPLAKREKVGKKRKADSDVPSSKRKKLKLNEFQDDHSYSDSSVSVIENGDDPSYSDSGDNSDAPLSKRKKLKRIELQDDDNDDDPSYSDSSLSVSESSFHSSGCASKNSEDGGSKSRRKKNITSRNGSPEPQTRQSAKKAAKEHIELPELPEGWRIETRGQGTKRLYKVYVSPEGKQFRSLAQAQKYLDDIEDDPSYSDSSLSVSERSLSVSEFFFQSSGCASENSEDGTSKSRRKKNSTSCDRSPEPQTPQSAKKAAKEHIELPEGWRIETRGQGGKRLYKMYVSPQGKQFPSLAQAQKYLASDGNLSVRIGEKLESAVKKSTKDRSEKIQKYTTKSKIGSQSVKFDNKLQIWQGFVIFSQFEAFMSDQQRYNGWNDFDALSSWNPYSANMKQVALYLHILEHKNKISNQFWNIEKKFQVKTNQILEYLPHLKEEELPQVEIESNLDVIDRIFNAIIINQPLMINTRHLPRWACVEWWNGAGLVRSSKRYNGAIWTDFVRYCGDIKQDPFLAQPIHVKGFIEEVFVQEATFKLENSPCPLLEKYPNFYQANAINICKHLGYYLKFEYEEGFLVGSDPIKALLSLFYCLDQKLIEPTENFKKGDSDLIKTLAPKYWYVNHKSNSKDFWNQKLVRDILTDVGNKVLTEGEAAWELGVTPDMLACAVNKINSSDESTKPQTPQSAKKSAKEHIELPEGWRIETREKGSKKQYGKTQYKVYISPQGKKFYALVHAQRYLLSCGNSSVGIGEKIEKELESAMEKDLSLTIKEYVRRGFGSQEAFWEETSTEMLLEDIRNRLTDVDSAAFQIGASFAQVMQKVGKIKTAYEIKEEKDRLRIKRLKEQRANAPPKQSQLEFQIALAEKNEAELTEYEKMRLANMRERLTLFNTLGIEKEKKAFKVSQPVYCSTFIEPRQKSSRIKNIAEKKDRVQIQSIDLDMDRLSPLWVGNRTPMSTVELAMNPSEQVTWEIMDKDGENLSLTELSSRIPVPKLTMPATELIVGDRDFSKSTKFMERLESEVNSVGNEGKLKETVDTSNWIDVMRGKVSNDEIISLDISEELIAFGDKGGGLGFWLGEKSLLFRPHNAPVCRTVFAGSGTSTRVLTASHDGTVRSYDASSQTFELTFSWNKFYSHKQGVVWMELLDENSMLLNCEGGDVLNVDRRDRKVNKVLSLPKSRRSCQSQILISEKQEDKIYSKGSSIDKSYFATPAFVGINISIHPVNRNLISLCDNETVVIYDTRNCAKPISSISAYNDFKESIMNSTLSHHCGSSWSHSGNHFISCERTSFPQNSIFHKNFLQGRVNVHLHQQLQSGHVLKKLGQNLPKYDPVFAPGQGIVWSPWQDDVYYFMVNANFTKKSESRLSAVVGVDVSSGTVVGELSLPTRAPSMFGCHPTRPQVVLANVNETGDVVIYKEEKVEFYKEEQGRPDTTSVGPSF